MLISSAAKPVPGSLILSRGSYAGILLPAEISQRPDSSHGDFRRLQETYDRPSTGEKGDDGGIAPDDASEPTDTSMEAEDSCVPSWPAIWKDELRIIVARYGPLTAAKLMWEACPDGTAEDRKPTIVTFVKRCSERGIPAGNNTRARTAFVFERRYGGH